MDYTYFDKNSKIHRVSGIVAVEEDGEIFEEYKVLFKKAAIMTLSEQGCMLGKIDIAEVDMYEYMLGKKTTSMAL